MAKISTFLLLPLASSLFVTSGYSQIVSNVNDGHLLSDRWSRTGTQFVGPGLDQGDATTLTWGIVADGTNIIGSAGEPTSVSDLVNFLDNTIGSGGGGSDLTNRPWFSIFEDSYNRWGEISGLSFSYEPADDGLQIDGFTSTGGPNRGDFGNPGVRADMRIGGHFIDGESGSNTLAYNFFPDNGEMVIDTSNPTFFGNSTNNFVGFRNVITHEIGHGLGIEHLFSDANFLLEPFVSTAFDGPQHSDILAVHRGYGDNNEEGNGNDTAANATALGSVTTFNGIGLDGDNAVVAADDVDFVSIDGSSDTDFYSIVVDEDGELDIALEALGLVYTVQAQDETTGNPTGPVANVDTSELNNLSLTLFDTDGSTVLATANGAGLGEIENILGESLTAGTYFIQVSGSDDKAQFYSLTTNFRAQIVPEPQSALLLVFASLSFWVRRRKA